MEYYNKKMGSKLVQNSAPNTYLEKKKKIKSLKPIGIHLSRYSTLNLVFFTKAWTALESVNSIFAILETSTITCVLNTIDRGLIIINCL